MKITKTALVLLTATSIATSGCATLFAKETANVTVNGSTTSVPKKEDVVVDGCQLESGIYWGWVVLDLFLTGPIGIIVDAVTGDWKHLDADCATVVNNP